MKKSNYLKGLALLFAILFMTSCSHIDNPISSNLVVEETEMLITMGGTGVIKATTTNTESPITYVSSDPSIATVDQNGVVTALKDGKVDIIVSVAGTEDFLPGQAVVEVWSRDTDLWDPLTLEATEDGELKLKYMYDYMSDKTIYYTVNDGDAQAINDTKVIVELNAGDKVKLYSANTTTHDFNIQGVECYIYGNVMSLITPDGNWYENKKITDDYALENLFAAMKIKKHETRRLMLPATELGLGCYRYMFANSNITEAPELPATNLATLCYSRMFGSCTSLTKAPKLPAEKIEAWCYQLMFYECTALTEAPELPAKVMKDNCYEGMFSSCKSLTKAPELPATKLADNCYVKMFAGCTALTKAPELPAEKLNSYCYSQMFFECAQLKEVKCMATDISATKATWQWLDGVAENGTFTKAAGMNDWTEGSGGIPSGWTVNDAE